MRVVCVVERVQDAGDGCAVGRRERLAQHGTHALVGWSSAVHHRRQGVTGCGVLCSRVGWPGPCVLRFVVAVQLDPADLGAPSRVAASSAANSARRIVRNRIIISGVPWKLSNIFWRSPQSVRNMSRTTREILIRSSGCLVGPGLEMFQPAVHARVLRTASGREDNPGPSAQVQQLVRHLRQVLEVVRAAEVDDRGCTRRWLPAPIGETKPRTRPPAHETEAW